MLKDSLRPEARTRDIRFRCAVHVHVRVWRLNEIRAQLFVEPSSRNFVRCWFTGIALIRILPKPASYIFVTSPLQKCLQSPGGLRHKKTYLLPILNEQDIFLSVPCSLFESPR